MLRKCRVSVFLLLLVQGAGAQFYKSILPSPEFNSALEKIVRDFRYNFEHIQGDHLPGESEVDTYSSTIKLPGASECTIARYHSANDTTASWHGVLYDGEDYKEAVKVYRNTFRMINKSRMQLVDRTYLGFYGDLQEPSQAVRFTVSTLQLNFEDPRYDRFKAIIELVPGYTGWQVSVSFFNKKPDNEID